MMDQIRYIAPEITLLCFALIIVLADLFFKQKKPDKAVAVCTQLRAEFKDSPAAVGAGYLLALTYRDRQDYKQAAQLLDQTGKAAARDSRLRSLAAEVLAQAAEIYYNDLQDVAAAIPRYEEAVGQAREADSERAGEILRQCYFRLGEYNFAQKKWAAELDYYVLLKNLGSNVNILPRIVACQTQLGVEGQNTATASNLDRETLAQKIRENPGTALAAEAEVFLLDSRLSELTSRKANTAEVAPEYEQLLTKYPPELLAKDHLAAYICVQQGNALAQSAVRDDRARAVQANFWPL